jgi:hypothetical protein
MSKRFNEKIVGKVEKILVNKGMSFESKDSEKNEIIEGEIKKLETEIDGLVFQLYGFNPVNDKTIISQIEKFVNLTTEGFVEYSVDFTNS